MGQQVTAVELARHSGLAVQTVQNRAWQGVIKSCGKAGLAKLYDLDECLPLLARKREPKTAVPDLKSNNKPSSLDVPETRKAIAGLKNGEGLVPADKPTRAYKKREPKIEAEAYEVPAEVLAKASLVGGRAVKKVLVEAVEAAEAAGQWKQAAAIYKAIVELQAAHIDSITGAE